MTYALQNRLRHIADRHTEVAGEEAEYTRGLYACELTVTPILAQSEEFVPGVAITRIERQDFCIDAGLSLVHTVDPIGNPAIVLIPQPGDLIEWDSKTFRLVYDERMGTDEPCFQYTTSARDRIRVHSEQIA